MELSNVGQVISLNDLRDKPIVKVIMVIKAPRGICQIFENPPNRHYAGTQCEAVRAFMEQHNPTIIGQEDNGEID